MKALEFETQINPDHTLVVPEGIAARVPPGSSVRVLLLLKETEEQEWTEMAAAEFVKGYAESDAIYDQLPGR